MWGRDARRCSVRVEGPDFERVGEGDVELREGWSLGDRLEKVPGGK